jgi:diguanylate cyclase (GGDEF)-like protein
VCFPFDSDATQGCRQDRGDSTNTFGDVVHVRPLGPVVRVMLGSHDRMGESWGSLAYGVEGAAGPDGGARVLADVSRALEESRSDGGTVAVVCVGLDQFRAVNDAVGREGGDDALRQGAAALAGCDGVQVVAIGGDEFIVIATGRAVGDEVELVAALRAAITRPVHVAGLDFRLGASLGVTLFPEDGDDAGDLVDQAEAAMHDAKAAGGRQTRRHRIGQPLDRAAARARLALTDDLPRAIERDELTLHWQPIVDLTTMTIMGLEALVRWDHPERGLLYPGEFIAFAEATGLISDIDEWVASAVTAQRQSWQQIGLDPYVGFNLSPQIIQRPEAIARLVRRLQRHDTNLDHVTIELTESAAVFETGRLAQLIAELDGAGLTVGLDDFGKSYSSLNRLREISARWVKLDRAFLTDVPGNPTATRVLLAVIDLVRALEFDCVVEGIEHEDQLALLRDQGVTAGQGFLLGRPARAEDLLTRLRESPPSRLRGW